MRPDNERLSKLRFLARVVERESRHLAQTDARLFSEPFTESRVRALEGDVELAERVEAFVGRYGRLQDTLADKLLPALLTALGETTGAVLDNLDRAERLGWLESADDWMAARQLRNRMIHEYVEDPAVFADALQEAHGFCALLQQTAARMLDEMRRRSWN
ncbi:MAG: hypothetical protein AB1651_10620 [Pseudomonadota bacterium]